MKTLSGLAAVFALTLPLLAQQTGTLKVKADPGRAGVFLDGKYLGPAANFKIARTYSVPAGDHELKLVEPRYQEVTKKIKVTAGKKTVVSEKLTALPVPKPPFGGIRTPTGKLDKFSAVYINDKFYGHIDEFSNNSQRLLLPPGEYTVRIEPPGGGSPITKKVTVEANKTVTVP